MLEVKVDKKSIEAITKRLDEQVRNKIPAAVTKGINRAAYDTRDGLSRDTAVYLDRPTPFTRRAFAVLRASVRAMVAYVYIHPIQREYLKWVIDGGVATKNKITPGYTSPKNAYGNLRRGAAGKAGVYKGKLNNRPAYWKDKGRGKNRKRFLVGWVPIMRSYSPQFPFWYIGYLYARIVTPPSVKKEVGRAIRAARAPSTGGGV